MSPGEKHVSSSVYRVTLEECTGLVTWRTLWKRLTFCTKQAQCQAAWVWVRVWYFLVKGAALISVFLSVKFG